MGVYYAAGEVTTGRMALMTPGEIAGLVIGFVVVSLISLILIWHRRREQKILKKKGLTAG